MSGPVLSGVRPHHFSIAVPDIVQAIRFWTEVFGFDLAFRFEVAAFGGQGAFLDGPGIRLELWQVAGAAPVPEARKNPNQDLLTAGTKHIAFRVPDVQAAIAALVCHGVSVAAVQRRPTEPMIAEPDPASGDIAFACFIHDPFGTLIELVGPDAG